MAKCVLEYGFKNGCVTKFAEKKSMTEFTIEKVAVRRVATFLNMRTAKFDFNKE